MPSLAEVLTKKLDALTRRMDKSTGWFEVATVTPTFTVYLNGVKFKEDGTTSAAVAADRVLGPTYTVGMKGRYIHDQGQKPFCLPKA